MKFNLLIEQLLESLDNPYPYQYSERDGGFIFFPDPKSDPADSESDPADSESDPAAADSDSEIQNLNPNNQSILYTVMMLEDPDYPLRLNILFHYTDEDKNIQGTTDMTGTGDAFRVMATVVKIVKDYLNSYGPNKYEIIQFDAKSSDHGKVVLYKRLAQKLKDQILGPRWDLDVFRSKTNVTFELSRNHSVS
jgi:hypothetical protein